MLGAMSPKPNLLRERRDLFVRVGVQQRWSHTFSIRVIVPLPGCDRRLGL